MDETVRCIYLTMLTDQDWNQNDWNIEDRIKEAKWLLVDLGVSVQIDLEIMNLEWNKFEI